MLTIPDGPSAGPKPSPRGSFGVSDERGADMMHAIPNRTKRLPPLRVGVGGPVGSGKTTLVEMLCKTMRERWDLVVVTNDIYTRRTSAS